MIGDIHDRAIHSQGREMCLALATICECCSEWDGARTLRHAAEYLYHEKYRALMEPPNRLKRWSRNYEVGVRAHSLISGGER